MCINGADVATGTVILRYVSTINIKMNNNNNNNNKEYKTIKTIYARSFVPAKVGEDIDRCAVAVFAHFPVEYIVHTHTILTLHLIPWVLTDGQTD